MRGIEFVNDLRCNYMTIPYEGGEEDFALRMMTENATDAFLSMELRRLDGQAYLYYNISGMQSMEILYGEKPIGRKTFQEFVWQLHAAIEESGELFLPADGVCLEPSSLFWELGTGRWKFMYIPGQDAGEPGQMRGERENFAEFLVMHIDYEDKELTETAYRFYEEICAGVDFPCVDLSFGMSGQGAEPQKGGNDFSAREVPAERMEWGKDGEEEFGCRTSDRLMEEAIPAGGRSARGMGTAGTMEAEEAAEEEERLAAYGGRQKHQMIPCILLGAAIALTLVSSKIMPEMTLYCGAVSGAIAVILLVMSIKRRKRKDCGEAEMCETETCEMEYVHGMAYVRDEKPEEFFGQPPGREAEYGEGGFAAEERTVYMEIEEKQERKLYGIGKYRRQKIFLESLPCLAGKDKTLADHVISDPSVSRMHAKFSVEGETVWMQDLNSTNGTYHNGMRLKPNERVALEPEDEIGFGQARFVFR